mgnify:CR=1 FL=1
MDQQQHDDAESVMRFAAGVAGALMLGIGLAAVKTAPDSFTVLFGGVLALFGLGVALVAILGTTGWSDGHN